MKTANIVWGFIGLICIGALVDSCTEIGADMKRLSDERNPIREVYVSRTEPRSICTHDRNEPLQTFIDCHNASKGR